MDSSHAITLTALSSMAVGAFMVALSHATPLIAAGGLAFGLGFATITTMAVAKLDHQK